MRTKILLILFFVCFRTGLSAQMVIDLFICGIKAGKISLNENQNQGGISLKKSVFTCGESLSIKVSGKSAAGDYTRIVQVTAEDGTPMHTASETPGTPGQFVLTKNSIVTRLQMGGSVVLYLEKTPLNGKESVTRIYLGTLTGER